MRRQPRIVRDLADLGVAPPVVGGEAADGIVVEVAWPDQQLVVDLDLTDDDRDDLVRGRVGRGPP